MTTFAVPRILIRPVPRGQRLGPSFDDGDAFAEPGPYLRKSDQRGDDQTGYTTSRIHEPQDMGDKGSNVMYTR